MGYLKRIGPKRYRYAYEGPKLATASGNKRPARSTT
jgi:hypothetical protein